MKLGLGLGLGLGIPCFGVFTYVVVRRLRRRTATADSIRESFL